MDSIELEVKILDINPEDMHKKLLNLNAVYIGETKQKIYTYDCYDVIILYRLALFDYKNTLSTNSLQKIANIYSYIEPVINNIEKEYIKSKCGFDSIKDYINTNLQQTDLSILKDKNIQSIIKNAQKRFYKWIRLREDGNKTEITIKYIYSIQKDYDINQVREIEISCDNFEIANKIIEEMGYFRKKLVEKIRNKYILDNQEIVIDKWPLINPYIEIEGPSEKSIYNTVESLGYNKLDIRVMNTEDVYLEKGIDLNDFEILTFNEQVKR